MSEHFVCKICHGYTYDEVVTGVYSKTWKAGLHCNGLIDMNVGAAGTGVAGT